MLRSVSHWVCFLTLHDGRNMTGLRLGQLEASDQAGGQWSTSTGDRSNVDDERKRYCTKPV